MPRYSNRFNRDWNFYLTHSDRFNFCGSIIKSFEYDPNGQDAKATFYEWEGGSRNLLPTKEPLILQKVYITKASINFHIKLWVEGFVDMLEPVDYYMSEFDNPPHWIRKAFVNALIRRYGEGCENWFKYTQENNMMDVKKEKIGDVEKELDDFQRLGYT